MSDEPDVIYHGVYREPSGAVVEILDENYQPAGTLAHVVKHSPTGIEWGYAGSGPADCARSLLIAALGGAAKCRECGGTRIQVWDGPEGAGPRPYDPARDGPLVDGKPARLDPETWGRCWCDGGYAKLPYQRFKFEFVALWGNEWSMRRSEILAWLEAQPDWPPAG